MDATAVVEVFDPGGDPGVYLVAGGEGAPVVVLGFEGGPKGWACLIVCVSVFCLKGLMHDE